MDRLWSPWRGRYIASGVDSQAGECVFCRIGADTEHDEANLVVHRGERAFVVLNLYPYITGHLMVVPYLHTADLASTAKEITDEMMDLTKRAQTVLREVYSPAGFNIGMNLGCRCRRRHCRSPSHSRAAALVGRHEFYDHRRRDTRPPGRSSDNLLQGSPEVLTTKGTKDTRGTKKEKKEVQPTFPAYFLCLLCLLCLLCFLWLKVRANLARQRLVFDLPATADGNV